MQINVHKVFIIVISHTNVMMMMVLESSSLSLSFFLVWVTYGLSISEIYNVAMAYLAPDPFELELPSPASFYSTLLRL